MTPPDTDHTSAQQVTIVFGQLNRRVPSASAPSPTVITAHLLTQFDTAPRASLLSSEFDVTHASWQLLDESSRTTTPVSPPPVAPTLLGAAVPHRERRAYREDVQRGTTQLVNDLAPLAVVRRLPGTDQVEVHALSQLEGTQTLFVRVATYSHAATPNISEDHVWEALPLIHRHHDRAADEAWVTRRAEAGTEIEHKFTIDTEVSTWEILTGVYGDLSAGALCGYATEFKDAFQVSIRHNRMYELVGPEGSEGYVTFIADPHGAYAVKHKAFKADTLRRTESIKRGVRLRATEFSDYLATRFPAMRVVDLGTFHRNRLDLNVESRHSGHIFAVNADETWRPDAPEHVLRQVECEYIRSRWHDGISYAHIDDELGSLHRAIGALLLDRGIRCTDTFYSKLSFMRDTFSGAPSDSAAEEVRSRP